MNPLAALAWVRARDGRQGIARVLALLEEPDLRWLGAGTETKTAPLTPTSWLPFAVQCRLLRAIDRVYGDGDLALLFHVGKFMAARDIPRVFRPLLRLGNPTWVISVSTRLWRYYHDQGRWELVRTPDAVLATLCDHHESDAAFCTTLTGWITGAIEVSGGQRVEVEHALCQARGAQVCAFTARYGDDALTG